MITSDQNAVHDGMMSEMGSPGAQSPAHLPAARLEFLPSRPALGAGVLALAVMFGSAGWTQPAGGRIRGVVETSDGTPLPQAMISLLDGEGKPLGHTTADAEGAYQFLDLAGGTYRLEATAEGYLPSTREDVPVAGDAAIEINFRLQTRRTTLREAEERGAEERNPNIFIRRIDNNALRDPLFRKGFEPVFVPFSAAENQYGLHMGTPVHQISLVRPQDPRHRFHASFYEVHENSALSARPFFNVGALKPSKRNQFGLTAAGPLLPDTLFLTNSLELVRESGFVNGNLRAPLPEERTPRARDPETAAIVAALLEAYPDEAPNLPGVAARQLNTNAIRRIESLDWNLRLDYPVSDRDTLAFQYTLFDYSEDPFELVAGQNPQTDLRPQTFSATHSHAGSARTLLQSSFQFDRLAALLLPTERFRSLLEPLGLDQVPDVRIGGGSGGGDLSPIGAGPQFPRERFQNRFSGNLDVSHQKGRHRLRFGGRTTRVQVNDLQSDNSRGTLIFGENFGRNQVENFLYGTPSKFTITLGDLHRGFRNWEHALYLQDTYQMRAGLTLNLGLRYEVVTVPSEVQGRTQFSHETDDNNFAPHLALAWAPAGGSTVVRAGYGISFGHIFPATYQLARFNPPAVQTITVQNPSLSDPLGGARLDPGQTQRSELLRLSPDLVSPYAHQYNLVIQRRLPRNLLFEIGYLGHRTVKPFFRFISNRARVVPGIPSTLETVDARRPDPRFFRIQTVMNSGTFFYDGLKVGLTRVGTGGLSFDVDYLFSKALSSSTGDLLSDVNLGLGPPISQNNQDFLADLKGPSPFDHRHIVSFQYSYEFPFRFSNGVLASLLEGWQISGMTEYRTGRWFGIETSSDAPGFGNVDGEGGDRPNLLNPEILGKTIDDPDTATMILRPEFFNTDIPPGGRGNEAVRAFRADAINNTNLALTKSFIFADRADILQFRTEFRNLFNRPWFAIPEDVFPTDIFGKIADTQNKGRVVQFMLRLNF